MKKQFAAALAGMLLLAGCSDAGASRQPISSRPAASSVAAAEELKTDRCTVVCPRVSGTVRDIACRMLAADLREYEGCEAEVENRTGADGRLALKSALEEARQGTVLLAEGETLASASIDTQNTLAADESSLILLCKQAEDVLCMAVRPEDDRFNSWKDTQALLSGGSLKTPLYSDTPGCPEGVLLRRLKEAGFSLQTLPGGDTRENLQQLLDGKADVLIGPLSSLGPDGDLGSVKLLCLFGTQRHPFMPDLPCFEELSGIKITGARSWGYALIPGEEADKKLGTAVKNRACSPDAIAALETLYLFGNPIDGEEYARAVAEEREQLKKLFEKQ